MASSSGEPDRTPIKPAKRPRMDENNDDNIEERLPRDVNKWTDEQLHRLGMSIIYEKDTTPLELLERFPLTVRFPVPRALQNMSHFLCTKLTVIEHFFNNSLIHEYLDTEFKHLQRATASRLRRREFYNTDTFLDRFDTSAEMRLWFQRFQEYGMQFGEMLYNLVVKRDTADGSGETAALLCDYDFQCLFQAFASMFGLHSRSWCEPLLSACTQQLCEQEIPGKASVLYCMDVMEESVGTLQDILQIIAVCDVKKHSPPEPQQGVPRDTEAVISSTDSRISPPHIPHRLLGQHGGNLFVYYPQSTKENVICGLIIQETKVTFTTLKMKKEQYEAILSGRHPTIPPKLFVTRPYDFMKKEDRQFLIKPLLELAAMQELQGPTK